MNDSSSVYEELLAWQQGIGAFVGLLALVLAALFNFWLNRRRDAKLRDEEIASIITAIYGEIIQLQIEMALLAKIVANYILGDREFHAEFVEDYRLGQPLLYPALSHRLGLLAPDMLLPLVQFYSNFDKASRGIPLLIKGERSFNYSPLVVLQPALSAVQDIQPTLRQIEDRYKIPQAEIPDTGIASDIAEEQLLIYAEHKSAS